MTKPAINNKLLSSMTCFTCGRSKQPQTGVVTDIRQNPRATIKGTSGWRSTSQSLKKLTSHLLFLRRHKLLLKDICSSSKTWAVVLVVLCSQSVRLTEFASYQTAPMSITHLEEAVSLTSTTIGIDKRVALTLACYNDRRAFQVVDGAPLSFKSAISTLSDLEPADYHKSTKLKLHCPI